MPFYKIVGIGKESNRKRTKIYKANDESSAKLMAENDGTIVENIEFENPEQATDKQISYAKNLGLSFPSDININEMSHLISKKVDDDRDAPPWLLEYILNIFPEENGLSITKYIGIENLFGRIIKKYNEEKDYKNLIIILLYSIVNDNGNYNWSKSFSELADIATIQNIALELSKNQQVINSIKRYTARDYVSFGDNVNDEGFESVSNIKRTNAYKLSRSLLKDSGIIKLIEKNNNNSKNKSAIQFGAKNSNNKLTQNKGCLVSILLFVSSILVIIY